MEDLYVECLVARKPRPYETLLRGLSWGVTVLFAISALFIHPVLMIGVVILLLVDFFALPRLSVEYEYLYVSKSIEIDSIYSKQKRKRTAEYDLEQMEIFAPEDAYQLDEFKNMKTVDKDYTSGEEGIRGWILIVHSGQDIHRVRLEPNEEMIQAVRSVFPRKVFGN